MKFAVFAVVVGTAEGQPTPTPSGAYCPTVADLDNDYDFYHAVTLKDGGWSIQGYGGVATRTSFNLLGGYVEFDVDVSNVELCDSASLFAISPEFGPNGKYEYCEAGDPARGTDGTPFCLELDFMQSFGNCGATSAVKTIPGPGSETQFMYNGKTTYHMRVEYSQDGEQRMIKDGEELSDFNPSLDDQAWGFIRENMQSKGVVLLSWGSGGYVPHIEDCGCDDDDDTSIKEGQSRSSFSISNLVIMGSPVHGPTPQLCSQLNSTMTV